jgi:hypothetical protein
MITHAVATKLCSVDGDLFSKPQILTGFPDLHCGQTTPEGQQILFRMSLKHARTTFYFDWFPSTIISSAFRQRVGLTEFKTRVGAK